MHVKCRTKVTKFAAYAGTVTLVIVIRMRDADDIICRVWGRRFQESHFRHETPESSEVT
jgi:hypothetical protein